MSIIITTFAQNSGKEETYTRSMRFSGRGQYFRNESYKAAILKSGRSGLGKLGTGMSSLMAAYYTVEMIINPSWSNGINLGVSVLGTIGGIAAVGWFGTTAVVAAPWILGAGAIYGVIDFGVTIGTGRSAADWAGQWINGMLNE